MNAQLSARLRHLRLSGMVDALPGRVAQAEAAPLPHLEFLELLVEDELARRADRLFARRLKQAGIITEKTLADFDWTFNPKIPKAKIAELVSARFVGAHGNLLLIGPPGVGKSHIATAIAIGAIRAGRRAIVRSTFDLAADFAQADATGTRRDLVQQLTRVDLLVLEDFGMKKLGGNAAEDLLEVFVRRHEAGSTAITTNRPTQDWGVFLGDVPAATAILDRFLAHTTIGATITGGLPNESKRLECVRDFQASMRFISCEPLVGPVDLSIANPDWVIVGAATGPGAFQPEEAWVKGIEDYAAANGIPIFHKRNLKIRPEPRREWPSSAQIAEAA